MTEPAVLVFDVNETLLDLSPLFSDFEDMFGSATPMGEWFARMLHGSLVANHLDDHRSFDVIGAEALLTVAKKRNFEVSAQQASEVVDKMQHLPAHPDVIPGLERLVDAGFRTLALTNSSTRAANAQIENAGLHPLVQRVVSVEEVGRFKPDPAPYRHAAEVSDVDVSDTMVIAAHDWDVAGALKAGSQAAYIDRPGSVWSLPGPEPELVVRDLRSLANALIA